MLWWTEKGRLRIFSKLVFNSNVLSIHLTSWNWQKNWWSTNYTMQPESLKCTPFVFSTNNFHLCCQDYFGWCLRFSRKRYKQRKKSKRKKVITSEVSCCYFNHDPTLKIAEIQLFGHDGTDLSKYLLKTSIISLIHNFFNS